MMKIVKNPMTYSSCRTKNLTKKRQESKEESKGEQDPNPTTVEEHTIPENAWMIRSGSGTLSSSSHCMK
jgi:hypothetical protein